MITEFEYPEKRSEFEAFIAENKPNHIRHDCPNGVMIVYTGSDIPPQPVPEVVSKRQMWEELIDRGMLEAAKAAAHADGPIMENYFLVSNEYERSHPKTVEAITLFGMTPEQGDDLFRSAGTR